jgi:streptogramin lyase
LRATGVFIAACVLSFGQVTFTGFSAAARRITSGPDGNLWFTTQSNTIGRMTTAGVLTEFPVPTPAAGLGAITAGPDGNVWFVETGKVGRITPTGVITEFSARPGIHDITTGADGYLWYITDISEYGRISPSGAIEFIGGFGGYGWADGAIASGLNGDLWFTKPGACIGVMSCTADEAKPKIFRRGASGGVGRFTLFIVGPTRITKGPDGNMWFTTNGVLWGPPFIGRITPAGVITEFVGISSRALAITAGPDGNLWFTMKGRNRIGRITTSGVITEFVVPGAHDTEEIALGSDGNLWLTDPEGQKIWRAEIGTQVSSVPVLSNGALLVCAALLLAVAVRKLQRCQV